MNTPMSRRIRLLVSTLGLAGLIVALSAAPAAATPGAGFGSVLKARGTYQSHGTLPLKHGLDIVVTENTVVPNGRSGWHSHPGGAIVVVQTGEITTYVAVGNHCVITMYIHGQAFIENPGQPLNAVNTGSVTTTIMATFPGVPVGVLGAQRTDEPDPGICPVPPPD